MDILYDKVRMSSNSEIESIDHLLFKDIVRHKISGGIKCLRENGVKYTLNRILVHGGLKKGYGKL